VKPVPEVDFTELIPELKDWKAAGKIIDPEEWIGTIGSYEHLVAYAQVLWPDFVEHDDCVFRAGFTEEIYEGFMAQTNGDKPSVEAVMNHRHILDLFCNGNPVPTREMVLYVGRLLRDTWQAKLSRDFPARKFRVSFPEEHCDDLLQYEVTFFQER
jgi:hypothetical protein